MKYPKNDLAQLVIANCVAYGIEEVVVSPGSRNAPLTIGFSSHPEINTYSIVDERCAAFVALGIAQQKRKPVALVCTSGSALLNYYPAIAEAFYSDVPLVVLSADRPAHLIDIGDGQTIRQTNVFEKHSVFNANLKEDDIDGNKAMLEEAFQAVLSHSAPIHINIPFDEPLYEYDSAMLTVPKKSLPNVDEPWKEEIPLEVAYLEKYANLWNATAKKMVLVGTHYPDSLIKTQLDHLVADPSVLVLVETTSNYSNANAIISIDQLLFSLDETQLQDLQPEILLTFGGMVVSKKIKQFLRKFRPKEHWHIDSKKALDTFHCMTQHFKISPQLFFSQFFFLTKSKKSDYQHRWIVEKNIRRKRHNQFLADVVYSDLKIHEQLYKALPESVNLQLGNSSVVRYAQLFDCKASINVFCNRGTSGIDGSTSTAIGAAMTSEKQTVCITGDISFFYDSNALWNTYIPKSFRIIVVNNNGGGIFKFIPGPSTSDALEYFETPHGLNASHLCKMYGFSYHSADNLNALNRELKDFFDETDAPKLLEIQTPADLNDAVLKRYFSNL